MRIDAITLKQLRALQEVARSGSLTAAAQVLAQTPPAIHSRIKSLETAVGFAVLDRGGEGVGLRPSAQGRHLIAATERIEAILSQAAAQISALGRGKIGQVSLGVVSTGKYFAPGLVRQLNALLPEIDIALHVGNRESVIGWLDRGAIELAIMGRPPRAPLVEATPIGPHPHGIILPPDHPLAAVESFEPEDLLREPLIAREPGSGTRILMQRFLDQFTDEPPRLIEMDSNETIKQAVIAGLGVAMLSLHTVAEELRSGRLKLLRGQGLPVMRYWYCVRPLATPLAPPAARVFAEITGLNGVFLPKLPQGV